MAVASIYSYSQASLVGTVFKSEKESKSATRPTLTVSATPRSRRRRTRGRTSRGSTSCCSAATGQEPPRHPHRHRHPGQHQHRHRQHDPLQPAAADGPMPFPKARRCTSTTRTASPTAAVAAEYFLNAMYMNVPHTVPKDVLGETDDLGADASSSPSARRWGQGRLLRADQPAGLHQADQRPRRHPRQRQHLCPDRRRQRQRRRAHRADLARPNKKLRGRSALWFARAATAPTTTRGWTGSAAWSTRSSGRPTRPTSSPATRTSPRPARRSSRPTCLKRCCRSSST
jgi:hypothetical protein